MSFKSRLIEYCENGVESDCFHCPLQIPCNNVNPMAMPIMWGESEFIEMRSMTWAYMRDMSEKMSVIAKLMLDASEDDVKDAEKR